MDAYREAPGTLEERLWRREKWDWPENEAIACWWIANYGAEDKTQEVKLVCRSLACMRLELHHSRLASTTKLRAEWDRRMERNGVALDVLNSNRQLWLQAGGADPESMASPTQLTLDHCAKTVDVLKKMLEKHGPRGGLDSQTEDCENAVKMLRVVTWEAIRKEKYPLTPRGVYDELVRNAQNILSAWSGDARRREARMQAPLPDAGDPSPSQASQGEEDAPLEVNELRPKDKHGLDIDGEFRTKGFKKRFKGWEECIKIAFEIQLDAA